MSRLASCNYKSKSHHSLKSCWVSQKCRKTCICFLLSTQLDQTPHLQITLAFIKKKSWSQKQLTCIADSTLYILHVVTRQVYLNDPTRLTSTCRRTQERAPSVCVSILMDPTSWRDFGFNGTSWRKNLNQLDDCCWRTTLKIEVSSYIFMREQVISCDDHCATLIRPRQLYSLNGRSLWLKPDFYGSSLEVLLHRSSTFSLYALVKSFSVVSMLSRDVLCLFWVYFCHS